MVYSCRRPLLGGLSSHNLKTLRLRFALALACVVTLLTSPVARAEKSANERPRSAVVKKKKASKKKRPPVEAAEPEPAPAPEPEPVKELAKNEPEPAPKSEPPKDPWKESANARTELGPPGDKPQEDRSFTREAAKRPISVAPLVGFATQGLKVGLGIRAGYTLPVGGTKDTPSGGVYFGGAFMYHLGTSEDAGFASYSVSAFYPSGEVGYELRPLDRFVVRPYGGIGMLFFRASSKTKQLFSDEVKETSSSYEAAAFYPGCALHYDVTNMISAGGDARLLIPFEGGSTSFGIFASASFRF